MTSASVFDESIHKWRREMELPWGRLKYQLVQGNLAKHLDGDALHILDVGGGNGLDSIPLAQQGHTIELVDYSAEMLDDARLSAQRLHIEDRLRTHQLDVWDLPGRFSQVSFDVILCHNLLQYLDDVTGLIHLLLHHLKPGGLLSIVSVNRYSEVYHSAFLRSDLDRALDDLSIGQTKGNIFDTPLRNYGVGEIISLLQDQGGHIEQDYGIRCICDYWGDNERKSDPAVFAQIVRLEQALTDRYPYKLLARYFQIIARKNA